MKRMLDFLFMEKPKRTLVDSLVCPITRTLMVEPVIASDGNTYERSAILQWITLRNTSPLNPQVILTPATLVANRNLEAVIEAAIENGDAEPTDIDDWRMKKSETKSALDFYINGQIAEAAARGLPVAQGALAKQAFEARDYETAMHWATLAADVHEPIGTFYLAFACFTGRGQPIDWGRAFNYFIKIHDKVQSTKYICHMYKFGGYGVEKSDRELYVWSKRGMFECPENGLQLGLCYYEGIGVDINHMKAREAWDWCSHPEAMYRLGKMKILGQGGSVQRPEGIHLIEKAATLGFAEAVTYIKKISEL